jgi:hypothetical protein
MTDVAQPDTRLTPDLMSAVVRSLTERQILTELLHRREGRPVLVQHILDDVGLQDDTPETAPSDLEGVPGIFVPLIPLDLHRMDVSEDARPMRLTACVVNTRHEIFAAERQIFQKIRNV